MTCPIHAICHADAKLAVLTAPTELHNDLNLETRLNLLVEVLLLLPQSPRAEVALLLRVGTAEER